MGQKAYQHQRNMVCSCGYKFKKFSNDGKLLKTMSRLHGKICKSWREKDLPLTSGTNIIKRSQPEAIRLLHM